MHVLLTFATQPLFVLFLIAFPVELCSESVVIGFQYLERISSIPGVRATDGSGRRSLQPIPPPCRQRPFCLYT